MEAVKGCKKQVSVRVQGSCRRCMGSGGEPGTKEQTCPYCRGRGEVRRFFIIIFFYMCVYFFAGGRFAPMGCGFYLIVGN